MGRQIEDLIGRRFHRLVVLGFSHRNQKQSYWTCRCDCGVEKIISASNLKNGSVQSCGCLKRELAIRSHENAEEKRRIRREETVGRRRWDNPEAHEAASRRMRQRWAQLTPEERSQKQQTMWDRPEGIKAKERTAESMRAAWSRLDPQTRVQRIEQLKDGLTAEQRGENTRKMWARWSSEPHSPQLEAHRQRTTLRNKSEYQRQLVSQRNLQKEAAFQLAKELGLTQEDAT